MIITEECISCDACLTECPNEAISKGKDIYIIDPANCTECLGIADSPQCVNVCPEDCIIPNPIQPNTTEILVNESRKVHINW